MNEAWAVRQVPLRLQIGDFTIISPTLRLKVREVGLRSAHAPVLVPRIPEQSLEGGLDGYLERSVPIVSEQPPIRMIHGMLVYLPSQYERFYVDLQQGFEEYVAQFTAKTRGTIRRKIRRYTEHCGGKLQWSVYRSTGEIEEFYRMARQVSAVSYQERILDAGLPDSEEFLASLRAAAAIGAVRGYLLFFREKPVAYICCPVQDGVVIYQYVGYDPHYDRWSVGTILQWHALESLFGEGRLRVFDFTEGQSEHKRLFATHAVRCANVFMLRPTLRTRFLVRVHHLVNILSSAIGRLADRVGVKARLRRLIRFGLLRKSQ